MVENDGDLHPFGIGVQPSTAHHPSTVVDVALSSSGCGAWTLGEDGSIRAHGIAADLHVPSPPTLLPGERYVALTVAGDDAGVWLFSDRGRVVAIGSAQLHVGGGGRTDLLDLDLQGEIVDAVVTDSGGGYLLLGEDGGVFAFGAAWWWGSVPSYGLSLNAPVVGIVAGPDQGYWVVSEDGGVFAFGASYRGSVPEVLGLGRTLNQPIIGMTGYGNGYLQVAADGGIFVFSDEPYLGSLGNTQQDTPIASVS